MIIKIGSRELRGKFREREGGVGGRYLVSVVEILGLGKNNRKTYFCLF